MHRRLQQVTNDITAAQEALLSGYDPDRLYNFRVAARRIRSILKQVDSHRSRMLRKAWGGLAAVTGEARDWDVFLATSQSLLDTDNQREFEAINRDRVANAREDVIIMLNSSHWQRHIGEWREYLEQTEETAASPEQARESLKRALHKAGKRLQAAIEDGSDRTWHRYRIAVKEVRYLAEAYADLPGMAELDVACRSLQSHLGNWHDTVVQLSLLDDLPPTAVHEDLVKRIRDRQANLLSEIRNLPPIGQPE